jgi:hypothetical protein
MQKRMVIASLLCVFFIGFASAACGESQIIFKVGAQNNSHASLWNSSLTGELGVCYNEIYGRNYTGSEAHLCSGTNRLFFIYQSNNSHTAINNLTGYNIPVCFGDLDCRYDLNSTQCANVGGRVLASMYLKNNSHISIGDFGQYPVKICCSSRADAYWADMQNRQINFGQINSDMRLVVTKSNPGKIIYNIYKENGDFVKKIEVSAVAGGLTYALWKTSETGRYKFTAEIPGIGEINSSIINVSLSRPSTIPEVEIKPNCGSDFVINQSFEVTVNITDPLDVVRGVIDFGDGRVENVSNLQENKFLHNFSTAGTKKIIVKVEDFEDSPVPVYSFSVPTNLIIINESKNDRYIASCIVSPKNGQVFDKSEVTFNATTTRAFNYDSTSGEKTPIKLDLIRFIWNFTDAGNYREIVTFLNDTYRQQRPAQGIDITIKSPSVRGYFFTKTYPTSGSNQAALKVEFVD